MDDFDGFLRCDSGYDELAAAAKAKHKMRLNEAEGDVQIGSNETLVDIDWRAATRGAYGAMTGKIAGVVTGYAIGRGDFGTENDVEFCAGCGSVQAGGDVDAAASTELGRSGPSRW